MSRLERWSRRKRGLDAEPTGAADASVEGSPRRVSAPGDEPVAPDPEPRAADGDTAPPLDDTLPDPESLPPGSDFSRYLQEGVSQVLRRRALRRLWQADHYQVRDGLDDYDGDYSQLETLGREAAEQLRHWSRRVGDALEPEEDPADIPSDPDAEGADQDTECAASYDEADADTPPANEPEAPRQDTTGRVADDQSGIENISNNR